MRIAILSKSGIEKIVDETIQGLPVNQRFERVDPQMDEEIPYRVRVIPRYNVYLNPFRDGETIDLMGPHSEVPNFIAATDESEVKKMKKISVENTWGYQQNQLIVLDRGVFFRHLELNKGYYFEGIKARTIEGMHLTEGYCVHKNRENRNPQGWEKGYGGYLNGIRYGIGRPIIWESIVKDMIGYFLSHDIWAARDNKIIFGSERSRDRVIEILEKLEERIY